MTKLNVIHGLFIGMIFTSVSIHLFSYLELRPYKVITSQLMYLGMILYLVYWLYPCLRIGMKKAIYKKAFGKDRG